MKKVRLIDIFFVSMQIAFTAFGGGAAVTSYIRNIVVRDKAWISSEAFDQMTIVSNILPGPVIVQLLALMSYKVRGVAGVIVSLLPVLLILPGLFISSILLFETAIPQPLIHKVTIALIPFILILTTEYIMTLFRVQMKRNESIQDWCIALLLSGGATLLLYLGITTTIVIFAYLVAVLCYATLQYKVRGVRK